MITILLQKILEQVKALKTNIQNISPSKDITNTLTLLNNGTYTVNKLKVTIDDNFCYVYFDINMTAGLDKLNFLQGLPLPDSDNNNAYFVAFDLTQTQIRTCYVDNYGTAGLYYDLFQISHHYNMCFFYPYKKEA